MTRAVPIEYPTPWQKKTMWAALSLTSVIVIGALVVGLIYLGGQVLSYIQPLLIPIAVAAVLAYLLDPLVVRIMCGGLSRTKAVLLVFGGFILSTSLLLLWITPQIYHQGQEFAQAAPGYFDDARKFVFDNIERYQERYSDSRYIQEATTWIKKQSPAWMDTVTENVWRFVGKSVGGFLGAFGFLLGLLLIPLYLYYFLTESAKISAQWSNYLPLRASAFKDEVVGTLTEINGYLIAFFRGQLLVSLVDGLLTGILLLFVLPRFALLIGLMVAVLALVPYIGIVLCWLPAVIIAAVQYGDWQHPLIVTLIFVAVQQFEGWFISPKIVGDSVGLHPLTVIVSVFAWSFLLGGLLGAILAVPLTATMKVLLRRYVWQKKFSGVVSAPPAAEAEEIPEPEREPARR